MSVRVRLGDDVDLSRGNMLVRVNGHPVVVRDLDVIVFCSLSPVPIRTGARIILLHTSRSSSAVVSELRYRIDVNILERDPSLTHLGPNEIGRATIHSVAPLFCDPYRANRTTGSLVLVDASTNATIAAAMVVDPRGNECTP